jgi:hypothetical protein
MVYRRVSSQSQKKSRPACHNFVASRPGVDNYLCLLFSINYRLLTLPPFRLTSR